MIKCLAFRAYTKNTLRGFADLLLVRTGLVIRDCCLHERDGKRWISFPARQFTDQNGEIKWQALIEFASGAREQREQFRKQALEAIHAAAPTEAA
jgi:hypothetical protein